jgi:hypothetical protein
LFINIGISLLIGKLLNDYAMGFFLISLFYFIVALIVFVFRKTLIKIPIDNLIVSKLLKDKIIAENESNTNNI